MAIGAARIYLEAQESGLAREKAHVEGFAGKPAPTVNTRFIQAKINREMLMDSLDGIHQL